jgi:hypothetical protein
MAENIRQVSGQWDGGCRIALPPVRSCMIKIAGMTAMMKLARVYAHVTDEFSARGPS